MVDVEALDVALLLAGVVVGGVDEAATLSVVDVAAGAAAATEVDDAASVVDVAATCASTGLTMAKPTASTTTIALAPTNVMMLVFIQLFIANNIPNSVAGLFSKNVCSKAKDHPSHKTNKDQCTSRPYYEH